MNTIYYALYAITNTLVLIMILYILLYHKLPKFLDEKMILLFGFIIIILSKTYIIFFNYEIDFDESFYLGNALTLNKTNDVYWKDIDGATSGPFQTLVTLLFFKMGFPEDWRTFHFIYTIVLATSWLFYAKIILNYSKVPKPITYISILFPLFYIGALTNNSHNQFSTERIPILFLLISGYLLLTRKYFLGGVFAFLGCLAKLMVVPICFCLFIIFLIENLKERKNYVLRFLGGASVSASLLILILLYSNILKEAFFFYLERNIAYSTDVFWVMNIFRYIKNFNFHASFEVFMVNALLLISLAIIAYTNRRLFKGQNSIKGAIYLLLATGFTMYSIFKSGRNYDHYFVLTIFLLFFLFDYVLNHINWKNKINTYVLVLFFCLVYTIRVADVTFNQKLVYTNGTLQQREHYLTERQISNIILDDIKKNNYDKNKIRLKVWGWGGAIHIMTNLPQCTPNNSIDFEIHSAPAIIGVSKELSFRHLKEKKPLYFVVKIGGTFGFDQSKTVKNEQPELYDYVLNNYTKLFDNTEGIIVYKRKLNV